MQPVLNRGLSTLAIDVLGYQAMQQAVAANPAFHLLGQDQAIYSTANAKRIILTQLTAHPEINVVVASIDQMALGAQHAATQLGRTLRIVSAGGGASAIAAVNQGRWFATFNALQRTEGQARRDPDEDASDTLAVPGRRGPVAGA